MIKMNIELNHALQLHILIISSTAVKFTSHKFLSLSKTFKKIVNIFKKMFQSVYIIFLANTWWRSVMHSDFLWALERYLTTAAPFCSARINLPIIECVLQVGWRVFIFRINNPSRLCENAKRQEEKCNDFFNL